MTSRDTYDIDRYNEERDCGGTNIQVNTLIQAMMESEPCLFFNKEENLMANRLAETRGAGSSGNLDQNNEAMIVRAKDHPGEYWT